MVLWTGSYFVLVDRILSHMEKSCVQRKISDHVKSRLEAARQE